MYQNHVLDIPEGHELLSSIHHGSLLCYYSHILSLEIEVLYINPFFYWLVLIHNVWNFIEIIFILLKSFTPLK